MTKITPVTHIVRIAKSDKKAKIWKPFDKWGSGTFPSFLYMDWITALPMPPPPATKRDIKWRNLHTNKNL